LPPKEKQPPVVVPHQDPNWWSAGYAITASKDETLFAPPAATLADTVRLIMSELGLGEDFMTSARPDSVVAARLHLMQIQDGFRYDELKPYLSALARARTFADINSRAADMYDEPLQQTIQVPD